MNQPQKDALWYATALLLFAAIVAVFWLRAPAPPPPRPVVSAYYVWQMQWNDDVREAVRVADSSANAFMVLAGEVNVSGGELRLQRGYPDWESLAGQSESAMQRIGPRLPSTQAEMTPAARFAPRPMTLHPFR